jgi:hypothetical protein
VPAERVTRRRVQGAIVESHRRFFRQHYEATTPRVVSALIRGMFAAQRLRLEVALRFEALKGSR